MELRELASMIALRDPASVPILRQMAVKLNEIADSLESAQGFADNRGIADRVRMNVIRPDGTIRQSVDTDPETT